MSDPRFPAFLKTPYYRDIERIGLATMDQMALYIKAPRKSLTPKATDAET